MSNKLENNLNQNQKRSKLEQADTVLEDISISVKHVLTEVQESTIKNKNYINKQRVDDNKNTRTHRGDGENIKQTKR